MTSSTIVLDTCILSQFFKREGATKEVKDWFNSVLSETLMMSPITRFEIEYGLARLKKGRLLIDKFRSFILEMGINEEPLTGEIASISAYQKQVMEAQGRQFATEDLLIGALAAFYAHRSGSIYIATFNSKDFEHWGIPLINP